MSVGPGLGAEATAEQDALKDTLLSALYNRTVAVRKYALASTALGNVLATSSSSSTDPCLLLWLDDHRYSFVVIQKNVSDHTKEPPVLPLGATFSGIFRMAERW